MPLLSAAAFGQVQEREGSVTATQGRLKWLDITRLLCALMILGMHWLRACFKIGMFGPADGTNLVGNYQGQTIGLGMLPHVLIAGMGHSASVWLTNLIGIFGGFGWQGVNALIIVSGFSLTIALKGKHLKPSEWRVWFERRAARILAPFYLVVLPFLALYLLLLTTVSHVPGTFAAELDAKLHSVLQTPLPEIILSHTILLDPFSRQWQANFFAPAWWFIPAILLAYALYPIMRAAISNAGAPAMLGITACVTMLSYHLANQGIFMDESWYFIVLQESFSLTLGIVAGNAWNDPTKRRICEQVLFSRPTFALALAVFIAGNIANWSPATRIFASMLYGPGLALMLTVISKSLERTWVAQAADKVDSYDLYLVHQPFAFPVALLAKIALHGYGVFVGWFAFMTVASLAAMGLSFAQRRVLGELKFLPADFVPRVAAGKG